MMIPYTRYSEVAMAISTFVSFTEAFDTAWKIETQNLMKGNGKHGYTD